MLTVTSLDDIEALRESAEVECKLAAGRDGTGKLPEDFWPTYSAFANTRGGYVILGLKEKGEGFELHGIADPDKVRKELFNLANNSQKVSANLISDDDVETLSVQGHVLLQIHVRQATRRHKPVHLNGNPLRNTYRRAHDGDRLCDEETVKRMLAEQVEDSRDNRILRGYSMDDLSADTLRVYRQALRDKTPEHPYLEEDDFGFLRKIGGWRRDRETGGDGLTVAGLLMFGKAESIQDEFHSYFLDYQERDRPQTELRWIDRVTLDGTWSGNVFDFYRRVYRKLITDLKVPFAVQGGQRQDETPVHVALREALVNTLVHADYTGRASILVVKRPDMFGFRNPGLMRVPVEVAIQGGESDGRNRTMQQMFLLVGAGERAGSGIPKIYKGWRDQHWRWPNLYEKEEPSEQTLLELHMVDFIPQEVVDRLAREFGARFEQLSNLERLILATAAIEQTVTHARISAVCEEHPTDLSRVIKWLVQNGFLVQSGRSRGSVYHLPGTELPTPEAVFGGDVISSGPAAAPAHSAYALQGSDLGVQGSDLGVQGSDLGVQGSDLGVQGSDLPSVAMEPRRGRSVEGLEHPLIEALEGLHEPLLADLRAIAASTGGSGKVPQETMRLTVCRLCDGRYLTIKVLARLLGRQEDYLRQRILNPLVDEGLLRRAFPTRPNHPQQAYTSQSLEHCQDSGDPA